MKALLLFAMLQVPPDSVVVGIRPVYGPAAAPQIIQVDDSTVVRVEVYTDSLAAAFARGAEAAEIALARDIQACGCGGGPPDWFWAGSLALGVAALVVWSAKEETQINITNTQDQSQEQSTTVKRFPWYWPGRKKGHGG